VKKIVELVTHGFLFFFFWLLRLWFVLTGSKEADIAFAFLYKKQLENAAWTKKDLVVRLCGDFRSGLRME
jgi:hypothetical protein